MQDTKEPFLTQDLQLNDELTSEMVYLPPDSRPVGCGGFGDAFMGTIAGTHYKLALKRARFASNDAPGAEKAIRVRSEHRRHVSSGRRSTYSVPLGTDATKGSRDMEAPQTL